MTTLTDLELEQVDPTAPLDVTINCQLANADGMREWTANYSMTLEQVNEAFDRLHVAMGATRSLIESWSLGSLDGAIVGDYDLSVVLSPEELDAAFPYPEGQWLLLDAMD